ncbi:MAG: alpha/beta hydrolase [Elusimicrobia bacterium]|nr:alpha/beta hydrolase [Elusimicrobiota bacterium]
MLKILWLAAGLTALWFALRWFERANIYFPSRDFALMPQSFGLKYEELSLKTEDEVKIHGWFIPAVPFKASPKAEPADGPLASKGLVLLYCHGNAGNISGRAFKANIFHRLGLGVLLFDYRGYGRSEGRPSERGTYLDAEAAYRWLTEERRVPPERILLYGESLGNAIAVETALRHAPKALILESAFTSITDMGKLIFPFLPVRWMTTIRYDNLAKIPSIRCPVLILHSRDDAIVPFEMSRRLFEAAPSPKEFFEMRGTHDDGYIDSGEAYPRAIQAFLERRA